jgi:membrane-anchored protein YejM (alkaline phosphatase superfamily)
MSSRMHDKEKISKKIRWSHVFNVLNYFIF